MKQLEDWQLDMVRDGEAPDEWVALAQEPSHQERMRQLAEVEEALLVRLYRADCPPSLELGEWHLGLLDQPAATAIKKHLDSCPLCQNEVQAMAQSLHNPLKEGMSVGGGVLQRIVLTLQGLMEGGSTPVPSVALRGESWTACYAGGEYMLSLTRQKHSAGTTVMGSLLMARKTGQVRLRQGESVRYETTMSESATFAFDGVRPGVYDLVIDTQEVELIVPDLDFAQ